MAHPGFRRGVVLILVIGVLGVLVVLGSTFLVMARLERSASQRRLNATRAALLARSGIEDAMARLCAGQDPSRPSDRYLGEDWDDDGAVTGLEAQAEAYRPGIPDLDGCPVQHALRPTFFRKSPVDLDARGGAAPERLAVEGRSRGYSGLMTQPPGSGSATYSLKIEDESAKINVNGGFLDAEDRDLDGTPDHRDPRVQAQTNSGWNEQLTRILGVLGSQPEIGMPLLGINTVRRRPPGGYLSVAEVERALGTSRDLSAYLTISSWVDHSVIRPNAVSPADFSALPGPPGASEIKRMRLGLSLEQGGRPPVNLNAASRPVLVALLQGLQGVLPEMAHRIPYGIPEPSAPNMAQEIAAEILDRRRIVPFSGWDDFHAFCDSLVDRGVIRGMNQDPTPLWDRRLIGGSNLCGADLLKANFDPNTALNKQLPDQILYRWIDKSDLTVWSTEGSLYPTGSFRIHASGRLLDPGGRLLAQHHLKVMFNAYTLLRQTSQKDFVAGRTDPQDYLSLTRDPLSRTTGASASWRTWGGDPDRGLAAMTYPCALPALPGQAADFDGGIALATVEMRPLVPAPHALLFLQHFDDVWDAEDLGNGNPILQRSGPPFQSSTAESVWPPPSREPSTFCPDGGHAQMRRCPSYTARGNLPSESHGAVTSNRGVFGYWVKPKAARSNIRMDVCCVRTTAPDTTQCMGIGRVGPTWGMYLESYLNPAYPLEGEIARGISVSRTVSVKFGTPQRNSLQPDLRWHLVTAIFNTHDTRQDYSLYMEVRGIPGAGRQVVIDPTYDGFSRTDFDPDAGEDITLGGTLLTLGGARSISGSRTEYADSVIDEFALCDFGSDPALARDGALLWGLNRYQDGRYYKGEEGGQFLSAVLPGDRRLVGACWTAWRPEDRRMELLATSPYSAMPAHILPDRGQPRDLDAKLSSSLSVELLDGDATLASPSLPPLEQGFQLRALPGRFRYRVTLKADPENRFDDPALETPYLDDLTLFLQDPGGPRMLSWGPA